MEVFFICQLAYLFAVVMNTTLFFEKAQIQLMSDPFIILRFKKIFCLLESSGCRKVPSRAPSPRLKRNTGRGILC